MTRERSRSCAPVRALSHRSLSRERDERTEVAHCARVRTEHRENRLGEIPEWPKGSDCKSDGTAFTGSNPVLPTNRAPTIARCSASFGLRQPAEPSARSAHCWERASDRPSIDPDRSFDAGVVQWQNDSLPSCSRGFDSLHPLQCGASIRERVLHLDPYCVMLPTRRDEDRAAVAQW